MLSSEQRRTLGVIVTALGILAAFFAFIGIGYRVTNTAGSPISDTVLVVSILVVVVSIVTAVWHFRRPPAVRVEPLTHHAMDLPAVGSLLEMATRPEYVALDKHIQELARRISAPANVLPTYGMSTGNGLSHIEIDGETYHHVNQDRGVENSRFTTTSLEELMYMVFRDVAFSMSLELARPKRKPNTDYRRTMFPEQIALLHQLNPEWARRCAADHAETLKLYPFVDGKGP